MKPTPTFDSDGQPTEETLETIRQWPYPFTGLLDYVREAWRDDFGRTWVDVDEHKKPVLKLATGGWSANEDIARALRRNHMFRAALWQSSHRGGLDVYSL